MGVFRFILRIIYPPRCAMCGELLEPTKDDVCFCPKCRSAWEQEKTAPCPSCRQQAENCVCGLQYNKSRTLDMCKNLVIYDSENVKKIIFAIKTGSDHSLYRFAARELEMLIFRKFDISKGDCIIAYPQRSRGARKKYGHDQSKLLSKIISKDLGVPMFCGIKNSGKKEQKKLSGQNRGENAYKSYYIPEKYRDELKGKRVILIDDIVTTGATSVCAAALCKLYGASYVCCFCIAKTPRNSAPKGANI